MNKTQLAYRRRSSSSLYKRLRSPKRTACLKYFLELVERSPPPPNPHSVRSSIICFLVEVHVNESSSRVASKLRKWRQSQVIGLRKSYSYLLNRDHIQHAVRGRVNLTAHKWNNPINSSCKQRIPKYHHHQHDKTNSQWAVTPMTSTMGSNCSDKQSGR